MTDSKVTVFRAGAFTSEAKPDWLLKAEAIEPGQCLDKSLSAVLRCDVVKLLSYTFEVDLWYTPDGGRYVVVGDAAQGIYEVFIPEAADWPVFFTAHLAPLVQVDAASRTAEELVRICEASISYFRHGHGDHVDRETGLSVIDMQRGWFRRQDEQREAERKASVAAG